MIKSIVEESSLDSPYKSINLKRIEPHFANEISERLLLLHHEFDLPKGLIRITDRKSKRNLAYQATNVVSRMRKGKQYGLFDSNLNFSHNMFQTKVRSVTIHHRVYQLRNSPLIADQSGLTTIDHEFAHLLNSFYMLKTNKNLQAIAEQYENLREIDKRDVKTLKAFNHALIYHPNSLNETVYQSLLKQSGLNRLHFKRLIKETMGSYAAQSTREFFAEAFTISQYLPNYQKSFMSLFREILSKSLESSTFWD